MGDDDWKQLTSFLTGAFTVGLVWLLNGLQKSVPDNFTSRRIKDGGDKKYGNSNGEEKEDTGNSDGDDDDDDDDDLSFVDPWNAPLVYVSTQQRRMMRSSMTSMVNIKNNIGELPKRFKRDHWPWETIGRRVMSASDDDENNNSDNNNNNNSNSKEEIRQTDDENDDISIITTEEEKKENNYTTHSEADSIRTSSGSGSSSSSTEDEKKSKASLDEKELCIGSIFGLDVGGTLAKLVYFERKTLDSDPLYTRSKREKHYVQAVSAQTVLMARMEDNNNNYHPIKGGGGGGGAPLSPTRKLRRSNSDDQNNTELQQEDSTTINIPTTPDQMSIRRHTLSGNHIYDMKEIINVQKESPTIKEEEEEEEEIQEKSQQKTTNKKLDKDLKSLYAIRQESLPDDVRQFRHSIDFHSATEEVFDDDFRRCKNKDDEEKVGNSDDENDNNNKSNEVDGRNAIQDKTNDQSEILSSSSLSPSNNLPKRSKSMLDLSVPHDQQTVEALDRFYDFARRLDTHQDSISDIKLSFYCRELGGEFHFISFETRKMKNAMDLIRVNNLHKNIQNMGATGGGAHKFADVWEKELGIGMFKQDELDSLVAGMQFVLSTVVGECYTFRPKQDSMAEQTTESENTSSHNGSGSNETEQESDKNKNKYKDAEWWTRKVQRDSISYSSAYPYMLVTIGTGVSVLRVDGPRQHERVSGSTIGGGTFWGLMRLLTDVESFEDSMKLAEKGDLSKVDMMVGDIYGDNSEALDKLGLAANIVASSFGKLVSKDDPSKGLTQEDLARALLSLVTNNIGQVAYLNAKLHNTPRIYFVGSFLRENMISQRRLSYAIDYWSKGEMEALFLEHEGYFGALGAFLMSQNIEKRDGGFYQWETNP